MVKTKNKIFSIALCLILCLAMVLGGIKIAGNGKGVSATTHRYTEATLSGCDDSDSMDGTNLWWNEIGDIDERFVQGNYKSITITNKEMPTGAVASYDVSVEGYDRLKAYYIENGDLYDCVIYGDCEKIYAPVDSGYLFGDTYVIWDAFENLETINFECFDTSRAEIMINMFADNYKLSTIIGLDTFDTSSVTNVGGMFGGCESLQSLDLSSFTFKEGVNTNGMFNECNKLTGIYTSEENFYKLKDIAGERSGLVKVRIARAGEKFKFDFTKLNKSDFDSIFSTLGVDWYGIDCLGKVELNGSITEDMSMTVVNELDGTLPAFCIGDLEGISYFEVYYDDSGLNRFTKGDVRLNGLSFDTLYYDGTVDPLLLNMTYTFDEDYYLDDDVVSLLNKLLLKVVDDVEETGIDLYSGLAISGAMLVVACGCAVVLSKMKRKQSI